MATYVALDREINSDQGGEPASFLLLSVDPERDSPERLARYVRWFNPGFIGATGDHEALQRLTGQLGVIYARADQQETAMGYLVDHSASILLIDPQARLAAIFSAPHRVGDMAADYATLYDYYQD
jgi:protein SCO1/2